MYVMLSGLCGHVRLVCADPYTDYYYFLHSLLLFNRYCYIVCAHLHIHSAAAELVMVNYQKPCNIVVVTKPTLQPMPFAFENFSLPRLSAQSATKITEACADKSSR